jgi:hypothetical protein
MVDLAATGTTMVTGSESSHEGTCNPIQVHAVSYGLPDAKDARKAYQP